MSTVDELETGTKIQGRYADALSAAVRDGGDGDRRRMRSRMERTTKPAADHMVGDVNLDRSVGCWIQFR